jgi:hypothetical protein
MTLLKNRFAWAAAADRWLPGPWPARRPLIFFVHVPKTGGSTVNAILHKLMPDGLSHCESFIHDTKEASARAASCRWLSGHVDLSSAERIIGQATKRAVRYFACMRNPTDQVMSHYNWLIEIFHRDREFYEAHPPEIKAISETIRSTPKHAASIAADLERFAGLLLNVQSTYILGHAFDWQAGVVKQRLARYEMIVDSDDVHSLLSHLAGDAVTRVPRENVSSYHFDPSVFGTDEMRDFLSTRNARDEMLYRSLDLNRQGIS